MPRVTFVASDGRHHEVAAESGCALMHVARKHSCQIVLSEELDDLTLRPPAAG